MMPRFHDYESEGRKLLVLFTCQRCGATKTENLEDVDKDKESYGQLRSLNLPLGWHNLLGLGPLLCPKCSREYNDFMRMKEGDR